MTQQKLARDRFLEALVYDDPVQLYERAPCGFLSTTPEGLVVKCNDTLRTWLGRSAGELVGRTHFVELLTAGGRIYHETHYMPSLLMHGTMREVAFEMVRADGRRLPVLVNATLERGPGGDPVVIRVAVFDATERRRYEQELMRAKRAAEAAAERASTLARTLQSTLIPPIPPRIPGLEVAAVYRPAGRGEEVGGDFYDVFPVGPDDWVVTIGDVCGKGAEAAVVTALVRYTVRALVVDHGRPQELMERLNEVLLTHSTERFCTVVLLRLRRRAGGWDVALANGGHPEPLVLRGDDEPWTCDEHGPLVGVLVDAEFVETQLRLDPGDVLVLHTDGVVEARRDRDQFGERRFRDALRDHRDDPDRLVGNVVDTVLDFQGGLARDDIAVLALRAPTT